MTIETITWTDPDGASTTLTDVAGITGRGLPPVDFQDLVVPLQPGSSFRSVRDKARDLVVPILILGDSKTDYRTQLRDLAAQLHPSTSPGVLQVDTVDGLTRELDAWYVDGFQWVEETPNWMVPSLLFRACDPYWRDADWTQVDYTTGTVATFFPFFPLRLSSSEVFASATIDNDGDVDTWPVWNITGPGSGLILRNLTTGLLLSLTATLGAGESVEIDTTPGAKTVTKNDGTNLFGSLSTDSELWALAAGSNSIQIELTGATSASVVSLRYRRRYLVA
jgi:hypothetical protein